MQQSDNKITKILGKLFDYSKQNFVYLEKLELEAQDFEKIADNYTKRDTLLSKLQAEIDTELGKEFVSNNDIFWNETIQKTLELELHNLEKLKLKVDASGDKVRSILKNKSLLIYSK